MYTLNNFVYFDQKVENILFKGCTQNILFNFLGSIYFNELQIVYDDKS